MDKRLTKTLILAANSTHSVRNNRMCAILWYKNSIISVGYNSLTTHPLQARWASKAGQPLRICLHAEVAAVAKAMKAGFVDFHRCTLTIARVTASLNPGMAKPCPICDSLIKSLKIKEVMYT